MDKERFLQEARSVTKLSHPNICSIHSIDEHEGQQFIEMEYIEGQTLRSKINESGRVERDLFREADTIWQDLSGKARLSLVHAMVISL